MSFFFFKQKTAYEMRISDWSSDVCSSDLLVLAAAQGARRGGTAHMIVVSSVGASAKSRNFYLRTKGEMEEGLRASGFTRLDILRPGLLTGARDGRSRLGEGIAIAAAPLTDALLHGSLRRSRAIQAASVPRGVLALAVRRASGHQGTQEEGLW